MDNLEALERDVVAARAKLTRDLSVLHSREALDELTQDLKQEALEIKDAALEKVRSTARSKAEDILQTVKAKAAANPAAVLMIGAGIAWRLLRHPPVTAALIGAGLYGLLRTNAERHPEWTDAEHVQAAGAVLKRQVEDVAEQAQERATDVVEAVQEKAVQAAEGVQTWVADKVQGLGGRTMHAAEDMPEPSPHTPASITGATGRDAMLLAAAGAAVVAAAGIAIRRRVNGADARH